MLHLIEINNKSQDVRVGHNFMRFKKASSSVSQINIYLCLFSHSKYVGWKEA